MEKALVIGQIKSIYTYEYITEILLKWQKRVQVDILSNPTDTPAGIAQINDIEEKGCRIIYPFDMQLAKRKDLCGRIKKGVYKVRHLCCVKKYSLIHIHYVRVESFVAALCARKSSRLLVTFWGSDLLRASKLELMTMRLLLRRADAILVESQHI